MECQCEAICNYLPLPPNSKTTLIMIMMSLHSSSCKSSSPVLQLRTPFARSSVAVSFQRRRRNRYRCIIMMTSLFSNLIQTHNPSHFFFFLNFGIRCSIHTLLVRQIGLTERDLLSHIIVLCGFKVRQESTFPSPPQAFKPEYYFVWQHSSECISQCHTLWVSSPEHNNPSLSVFERVRSGPQPLESRNANLQKVKSYKGR